MSNEDDQRFEDYPEPTPTETPEAEPQEAEVPPGEDAETVSLAVTGPFHVHGFQFEHDEDGTVVITREGTEVRKSDADSIIEHAALNGVALTRKDQD